MTMRGLLSTTLSEPWSCVERLDVLESLSVLCERELSYELTRSPALHHLHESRRASVHDCITRVIDKEVTRQDLIDDTAHNSADLAKYVDRFEAEFDAYCNLFDDNFVDLTDDNETSQNEPFILDFDPHDGESPNKWPRMHRKMAIKTAALVHYRLDRAANRVHEELSREMNYSMLKFIEEIPACLRRAFELEEVTVDRKRKLAEICDADRDTAVKRAKLEEEEKCLRELENIMQVQLEY